MAPGSPGWVTAERRARKSGDGGRGASSVAGTGSRAALLWSPQAGLPRQLLGAVSGKSDLMASHRSAVRNA